MAQADGPPVKGKTPVELVNDAPMEVRQGTERQAYRALGASQYCLHVVEDYGCVMFWPDQLTHH